MDTTTNARFDELVQQCREKYALSGTRFGRMLHASYRSGSFLFCGARIAGVTEFTEVADRTLCHKCFPTGSPMRAAFTK